MHILSQVTDNYLDKVYGDQTVSYAITRWCVRFKQGRESLEDDPRLGHPLSVFTENDVTAVKNLIDEGAHFTIEEISETLNINLGAVFVILNNVLSCAK